MQVHVRHDDVIQGNQELIKMTVSTVESILERHAEHISTVEVHYADENGPKGGDADIRCSVEVRYHGKNPIGVTHHANDLPVALESAVEKAARMLDHQLGRIREMDRVKE